MAEGRPTAFTDLPAEIRTMIYELSHCLVLYRCHYDCEIGGQRCQHGWVDDLEGVGEDVNIM
jgi:hypothetical protein